MANTIYEVPLILQREKLHELTVKHFKLDLPPATWRPRVLSWTGFQKHRVKIGVVGKYMENQDATRASTRRWPLRGGGRSGSLVNVDAEEIEEQGVAKFVTVSTALSCPRFACGAWRAKSSRRVSRARKRFRSSGFCLGMQIAVVDFARDVLGLANAHSTEFNTETPGPVISMIDEQKKVGRWAARCGLARRSAISCPAPNQHLRHRPRDRNGTGTATSSIIFTARKWKHTG